MKSSTRLNRRDLFRAGALAGAAGMSGAAAGAPAARVENPSVYTELGVRPFINATATLTINGGSRMLDEVIEAIEAAGRFHVNLDELMEKAGQRLSQLLQCEAAMVTSGAAAAITHATSACVAGMDPEAMLQLPDVTGLKSEVIMPKWSRNQYDHAFRTVGITIVDVETKDQLWNAVSHRTAMMAMLGDRWKKETVGLDELAEVSRKTGIPITVDAAADTLVIPDPYLKRGASLVAYSGGKIIRGPQTAGMLIGRKDLIEAAWANSAPHHAFGRAMKVSKEEVVGMVKAVEVWVARRNIEAEYAEWKRWYAHIDQQITRVPGVTTTVNPPRRGGPFPTLTVSWDTQKVGLTAGEVGKQLLAGEPRIMTHASGDGSSLLIRPVALKPEEHKIIAARLEEIFRKAQGPLRRPEIQPPAANIAGRWNVEIEFTRGRTSHLLFLETKGNDVTGTHIGRLARGDAKGAINGSDVKITTQLPLEGSNLPYAFAGRLSGDTITGEVHMGEYRSAKFTARRHASGGGRRDPSKV
ncbi:MAG: hypothetical protein IPM24_21470 [Bryobacterales bacterium]|nr:hypothetical protein [Bryobacterales bacterium]